MSKIENITPERAKKLIEDGAVLIDVREAHEHARENIPGARHVALSQIDRSHPARDGDKVLIFHCKSGGRTNMNAARLAARAGSCQAYLLGGGIEAWKRAGLPTSAQPSGSAANANEGGILSRLSGLFR
ncbi:MAG TPA: rhodanese-like domain-containing protein [Pseudolabrys sp.]|jgi:rhodanese-related sulfurtransferase|nr:rhodanese-like domain-containing protein [Pseudolabrys sp.]